MIRAGGLRHRIELQKRTQTADGVGGMTTTWTRKHYARAAIWPEKAGEVVEAGRLEHRITHRIRIRHRSDVDASMRVKFGERYFDIVSIINREERNRELDLMAVEGTT